ncbi:hypothetical protein [Fusobacterium mortiferum]|uniref:Uncharacterized protein n=1 Tax=Fusobacterium mortiferum TaxID=850 RepID=A0ABS2G678_FUSMR|nr:hypothetical protein [Fusobacterium mortiferum]MBM6876214.1 hypothetical protein [Fusobacterium mortiferum]
MKNKKLDFKENKFFMEMIRKNDVFGIKSTLESFIVYYKADRELCDGVIEYAIKNSSFKWEEDDGLHYNGSFINKEKEYYFEKERLVQNFTKERYEKVLELYKEYNKIKVVEEKKEESLVKTKVVDSKKPQNRKNKNTSQNINPLMLVAAGAIVIIGIGYLLLSD